ncbi:uncharacterized protein LOC130636389 isoform X2 [Hydractinia symbiolongicarpus]|uniref:uncharacterized protein LOC130636389 isoform X2 n=1 Tax=Hydractinia symbiolongicarpus TaxID=13093 RepID=UPI00254F7BE9|nr:uncharacterized protein LOC130636389 isoform X2 [Hydractinia symbiolongicarpus]
MPKKMNQSKSRLIIAEAACLKNRMANMEPAIIHQQKQISKKKYRHRPCNLITFLNILISLCLFALYCEQRIQIYHLKTALAQVQEEAKKNEDLLTQYRRLNDVPSPRMARSVHHGNHTHFCQKVKTCPQQIEMIQLASPDVLLRNIGEITVIEVVKNWKEEHRSGQITYNAGKIEIKASGYYHIFAQMKRSNTGSVSKYYIMKNNDEYLIAATSNCDECTQGISRIVFLHANDKLYMKTSRNTKWWSAKRIMYFGAYRIGTL